MAVSIQVYLIKVMNRGTDVKEAVKLISKYVDFDRDARVSLFEINIRVMGGLLSSHILIERNPEIVKGYKGEFLQKGISLADRLLPAFNTTSGIPIAGINLRKVLFGNGLSQIQDTSFFLSDALSVVNAHQ